MEELKNFNSCRTPVLVKTGCASSNNPLATKAGLDILEQGGNAADAAVAIAAALAVTEPTSTGLGGDAFCLFYNAKTKTVHGLNGSGRCAVNLNLDLLAKEGFNVENPLPDRHAHTVTVPGAAAAWCDTVEYFGSQKITLQQILAPAINLAENGWPVTPVSAYLWRNGEELLKSHRYGSALLKDGRAPQVAEVMTLPDMAKSLKELAAGGREQFYTGRVGQAIVNEVAHEGGVLSLEDLAAHTSTRVEPIRVDYKGYSVWEIPPNGLGITALLALNILNGFDLQSLGLGSSDYLHLLIEALKLSFADTLFYVADPEKESVPVQQLLSKEYAERRRQLISTTQANEFPVHGNPEIKKGGDTVYLSVTDKEGNACSFINSNYMTFGTGIVPQGCGFTLHNRGALFSLDPTQKNALAPGKRPQHTIIPGMITRTQDNQLLAAFGIMGGFMQPQAHVQVLLGMIEYGLDPQQALDIPRFYIALDAAPNRRQPWPILLEKEVPESVKNELVSKGHKIEWPTEGFLRSSFGRGHIITRGAWFNKDNTNIDTESTVWWGAADPRCDGSPLGY